VTETEELIAKMVAGGKLHLFDTFTVDAILDFTMRYERFDELKTFLESLRAKFRLPPISDLEKEKHLVYVCCVVEFESS
jgi:hypothetical protein